MDIRKTLLRLALIGTGSLVLGTSASHAEFKVCNDTSNPISTALGYKADAGWVTEGWWTIPGGTCATLIQEPLKARYYYVHAVEGITGGSWSGPAKMCVQSHSFTIQGVQDCAGRGYEQAGFFEIDTGGQADWTTRLAAKGARDGS